MTAGRQGAVPAGTDATPPRSPARSSENRQAAPRRARRLGSGPAIRAAAARLFLEQGYQSTSMEEIAAAARVSKQTIYTHFADKEALFADLVLGNVDRVDAFVADLAQAGQGTGDVAALLRQVARAYLRIVIRSEVLQLRRLVIAEAGRFPDLARTYHERVPQQVYDALATLFAELTEQHRLRAADPTVAAHHFAWLLLGRPLDRAMFYGPEDVPTEAELEQTADAAVAVFLAAYGAPARFSEA